MIKNIIRIFFFIIALLCLALLIYVGSFTYHQTREGYIALAYDRESGYRLASSLKLWDIKRMLPFGNKIIYVSNNFYTTPFNIEGSLTSVDLFSNTPTVNNAFFRYQLNGQLAFRLKTDELLLALNNGLLESKKINEFYDGQKKVITSAMTGWIEQLLNEQVLAEEAIDAAKLHQDLATFLEENLQQQFNTFEWQPLVLEIVNLPNLLLYREILRANLTRVQAEAEAQWAVQYQVAQEAASQESRLKLLEDYGKLLTQYPILVQFFAVDSGKMLPREALEAFMPATKTE